MDSDDQDLIGEPAYSRFVVTAAVMVSNHPIISSCILRGWRWRSNCLFVAGGGGAY